MREEWGYGSCTELKEWGRGVDMNMFSPERRNNELRASKGISETDVVVLWVSRLVPEKRPDIWMNAIKRLQDEGLPVKAFVVGNGTFEKYLSKLRNVTCCGWMSGTALGEIYASSDILLFPSDVETFGNVTLEALSSGCPSVVEQKCGGHLVTHGVNGLVDFPPITIDCNGLLQLFIDDAMYTSDCVVPLEILKLSIKRHGLSWSTDN